MSSTDPRTLIQYTEAVASSAPTPGGGSVAAVAGALAAALAEMTANVTLAGKTPPENPAPLTEISNQGQQLREQLHGLALADEAAYGSYRAASAMPRSTDDEKSARRAALNAALLESARVPMEIADAGVAVLGLLRSAADHATKHVLSDVSTGAVLVESAIRGALYTAAINADMMKDPDQQSTYRAGIASITETAQALTQQTLLAVAAR